MHSWLIGKLHRDYGEKMHRLSIFDMDKTITRTATFVPFLAYAVPRYRAWRAVFAPVAALATLAFFARFVGRGRLKEINLRLMLGPCIPEARLAGLSAGFAGRSLATNALRQALDRVAAEQAEGRRVVLATASYDFYVAEIGRLIGVTDVVATVATRTGDTVSPVIEGENCYGPAKLRMVERWCAAQGIARGDTHVRFFSDHVSDAPCFEWADEAFAVNPHAPLRRLARERGWPVLDWR